MTTHRIFRKVIGSAPNAPVQWWRWEPTEITGSQALLCAMAGNLKRATGTDYQVRADVASR